tara:strand:+ start:416 stop:652 length:237 start_codon:yes stop_codon:yes gene_type:complete
MTKIDLLGAKNKSAFTDALNTTKYGDTIIYHVGRYAGGLFKNDALAAANTGLVNLVQKKLGAGLFQYVAQRTKKRFKK